jgi:hypothetical protein
MARQQLIITFSADDGELDVTYALQPNEKVLTKEGGCRKEEADLYNLALVCCDQIYQYLKREVK